ncbi:glycosyltransferase family 4 protein [Saccharospirillum salsuginis]|uniref:Glycosyl transferase family 1 n=1 Tax=Saccharospirillum salsuginis TaxID=418750 RepID=A0A918N965_9GAMM|nr:glycosyltransferase family 4 protein [Saccharospirillum salsuginis]GGX49579.1 glycosyl transferase family 1 [Saccharospirillum salsuginis]
MKPLRILQFITPAGFYGAERWVLALANNLSAAEVVCDLAVTDEGAGQDLSVAEFYPKQIGQVHRIPLKHRFDMTAIQKLCTLIRSRNIDVIHTHGYKSDILGLIAARRCNIKAVSTPHGFSGNVGFKLSMFIKAGTFSYRYFDRVVPLSPELLEDVRGFRVPESKIDYIANGVDLSELDRFFKMSSEEREDFHLGFVGQMIPRKGLRDLIDVFHRLWERHPRVRLTLVGDGSQRRELESYARSLPCSERIRFLGFQPDRIPIMREFDMFLMTSSLEGIPRCMMEAMAIGIPVVAYDIPGVDELVTHGKTGSLAPLGDIETLSNECEALMLDIELRQRLTGNARRMIEETYSAARMANEYTALFRTLVGPASSGKTSLSGKGV